MIASSVSDPVRCSFGSKQFTKPVTATISAEVYYAETKDLETVLSDLTEYISSRERQRAGRFRFEEDRKTYISSHAALRLILASKINTRPKEIEFAIGKYNKPYLYGNRLFFNLAHTREAFAIVVSEYDNVGIDLEGINKRFNFNTIIKEYFSSREQEYILGEDTCAAERFFLLWTRKEALLKSLGTGITEHLTKIEVAGRYNFIDKNLFDNTVTGVDIPDHYIYSGKAGNCYFSVALPGNALITYHNMNYDTLRPLFNNQ